MKDFYQKFVSYESKHDLYFRLFLGLFILFLFVPVKKVFLSPISFATGQFNDFTTYSLYMFDLVAIGGLLCFLWNYGKLELSKSEQILILILLVLPVFHVQQYRSLEYYYAIRLSLYICLSAMVYRLILVKKERFLFLTKLLLSMSILEVLVALAQFIKQGSLGLQRLGESIISSDSFGIAKVVSHGTTIVRPYGLFPHPNILSAVLGITIILSYIASTTDIKNKILYITSQYLLITGLIMTVSRGTIISIVVVTLFLVSSFIRNSKRSKFYEISSIIVMGLLSLSIFWGLISPRNSGSDESITSRVSSYAMAKAGILKHPFIGSGQGTSLLHVEQWGNIGLKPWEKEPIHNFVLLNMSEIGILATFLLIYAIFIRNNQYLAYLREVYKKKQGITMFLLLPIFVTITMLFDHYYSTSPIIVALLWVNMRATQAYLTSPYDTRDQKV